MTWSFKGSWGCNMKTLFFVASSFLLLSCTTFEESQQASLYKNYKSYLNALKTRNYDSAIAMLALHNRNRFSNSKDGEDFNGFFPFFSSVDTVITNEINHYQEFLGSKGCLTINGFDSVGEPTSLNFELLNENDEWKFRYVQMIYHESKDEFPSSAKCPPTPRNNANN